MSQDNMPWILHDRHFNTGYAVCCKVEDAFIIFFFNYFYFRSDTAEDKFVFCNGLVLHRLQCLRGFGEWLDSIKDFSLNLKSLNLDIPALASLSALTMITGKCSFVNRKLQTLVLCFNVDSSNFS